MKWSSTYRAAALLGCCLLVACRASDEFNAAGSPQISVIGDPVKEISYPAGLEKERIAALPPIRRYKNVIVFGEMTVKDFDTVCALVRPQLVGGETIFSIEVNPANLKYTRESKNYSPFITVKSCDGEVADLCPRGGRLWDLGFRRNKLCLSSGSGSWRY